MALGGADLVGTLKALLENKLSDFQEKVEKSLDDASSRLLEEVKALRERVDKLEELARKRQEALEQVTGRGRGRPPGSGSTRAKEKGPCSVDGCDRPAVARGLCKNHYAQQRYREKREAAGFVVRPRKAYRMRKK